MKSMKKLVLAVMLAVGLVCLGIPRANAAETDTITVTVTLTSIISVSVDLPSWAIAANTLSVSETSALFTATNDGNVTETFTINGENGAGGWTLAAAAGADTFALGFDLTSPYETFVAIDLLGVTMVTGVTMGNTQTFKMQYSMPTSNSKVGGIGQGFTITVTASQTL